MTSPTPSASLRSKRTAYSREGDDADAFGGVPLDTLSLHSDETAKSGPQTPQRETRHAPVGLDPLLVQSDLPKHHPHSWLAWLALQWRLTRDAAWQDLTAVDWRWFGIKFGLFVWMGGVVTGWLLLVVFGASTSASTARDDPCTANNAFVINGWYQYWSTRNFFEIDLNFQADLNFTRAKVIDISSDIVLGRLAQSALAYFAWRTFHKYITVCMQVKPISYRTYWAVFLETEPTLWSILSIIREFIVRSSLPSISAMVFIVLSMLFILAVPTIGAAMSGYTVQVAPFVAIDTGDTIAFKNFVPVLYIIHDGDRAGLTRDYGVPQYAPGDHAKCFNTKTARAQYNQTWPCDILYATNDYVAAHGINASQPGVSSTLNGKTITGSPLNVSAFYTRYYTSFSGYHGENSSDPNLDPLKYSPFAADWTPAQKAFMDVENVAYWYNNKTYDVPYLSTNGQCQTRTTDQGDIVYKWGFSFMQLNVFLVLLVIWSIGTISMWYKAHRTLQAREAWREVPWSYKAAVVISEKIQNDLKFVHDEHGEASAHYFSSSELSSAIRRHLGGGTISLPPPPQDATSKNYGIWRGVGGWFKRLGGRMKTHWATYLLMTLLLFYAAYGWSNIGRLASMRYTGRVFSPPNKSAVQFVAWTWATVTIAWLPQVFALRAATTNRTRAAFWCIWFLAASLFAIPVVQRFSPRY